MIIYRPVIFTIVILLSLASTSYSKKKKKSKDWNKIDVNDIDKNWKDGDAEDELEHEYEHIKKIQERKQKEGPKLNVNDPESIAKYVKKNPGAVGGGGGSAMIFAELKDKQPDGKLWDKRSQDLLASKWSALLRTASLSASVFNLEDQKLLLSIDKGWMTNDVMKFTLQQPEVVKVVWNNKDYLPKDYLDNDEDDL